VDLSKPHWRSTSHGRIQVETKDEMKRRLKVNDSEERGKSTDRADSVIMAFWEGAGGAYEEAFAVQTSRSLAEEEERLERERREQVAEELLHERMLFKAAGNNQIDPWWR